MKRPWPLKAAQAMSKGKGHVPIRTCISCGTKKPKKELIRLVLDEEGFVVRDEKGSMPGRGAYVCPKKECWEQLDKKKRLNKAFRAKRTLRLHPFSAEWKRDLARD